MDTSFQPIPFSRYVFQRTFSPRSPFQGHWLFHYHLSPLFLQPSQHPQQLPFFSSFLSINIIVISIFGIVPGARALWSLPHICVVYLPRKVLIFDYFFISLPHTHFLFFFPLEIPPWPWTWFQKLPIQFLRCLPGFLPLAPLAIFLGTNFNLLMGIIRQEESEKRVTKYLVSSFVHCKRKCAATQNNS